MLCEKFEPKWAWHQEEEVLLHKEIFMPHFEKLVFLMQQP